MSADLLWRAAAGLRDEWADDDGPRPMGTAWHRERDFHLAVADWLMHLALLDERIADCEPIAGWSNALAVARAYLGEAS